MKKKIILLTSVSSKKIPWIQHIKDALNKLNISYNLLASNTENLKIVKLFVDKLILLPEIKDPNKKKISDILKKNKINYIYPLNEIEIIFWKKNQNYFLKKNNLKIIYLNSRNLKTCIDKFKFYKYCITNNIRTPFTSTSLNNFKNEKKIIIKRKIGPSKGFHKIIRKNKFNTHKEVKIFNKNLYQEYIEGKEYSVDAWVYKNYKPKAIIIRTREFIEDGEARITILVKDAKLEKKLFNIIKKLKLRGHINLQFIKNKNLIYIIECNHRFGGASTFSIMCGLDSFYWTLLSYFRNEGEVKKIRFLRKNIKRQVRVMHDLYI